MNAFTTGKSTANPIGEPLWRAANRLRLELEGKMVSQGQRLANDPDALQIVGLLLQLEGLARRAHGRRELVPADSGPAAHVAAAGRDLASRG